MKHKRFTALVAALLALCVLCGCAGGAKSPSEKSKEKTNTSAGELTAGIKAEKLNYDIREVSAPQKDFAFASFELVSETGANPVYSPVSVLFALAMAAQGAEGETKAQFESLFGMSAEELVSYCSALSSSLLETSGSTELSIANSAWADVSADIKEEYLKAIVSGFDSEVFSADLDTGKTRKDINAWVDEKTNGLIPELLSENLDPLTVLVLMNAIYMDAKWAYPFTHEATGKMDFTAADGTVSSADFVRSYRSYRSYLSGEGYEGVLLPYDDGRTAFAVIRPDEGKDVRAMLEKLGSEELFRAVADAEANTYMNFAMPKLDLDFTVTLNEILIALGLEDAFDISAADFSAMGSVPGGNIYLSTVLQKAKIIVDEEGTRAAAVTAAMASGTSMPVNEPREMIFDSPYFYAVLDLETQSVLFMGITDRV